jgi:hypothetical protein
LPALSFALLAIIGAPVAAAAAPAGYDGSSADGKTVVFSTKDQLVPGDTDQEEDVYARSFDPTLGEYVTRELSIGPRGGNDARRAVYDGMSRDGNEVFFSTRERLVAADTDHAEDIYVRILSENRTVLVSQGAGSSQATEDCSSQNCGNREIDASFVPNGVPRDGGRVFFATTEALTGADKDGALDVYVRNLAAETTELVSAPEASCGVANCGNGAAVATFLGTDDAGDKAYFSTTEPLSGDDSDSSQDIYQRDILAKRTALVSIAGTCPPTALSCSPSFGGVSGDGSHVFFETSESHAPEDSDESQDVYDWSAGALTLASTGPDGGNAPFPATYAGTTADGSAVYFQTQERLDPAADTDAARDVYVRSGGTTTLVSTGPEGGNAEVASEFQWASADGSAVVFSTEEALVAGDTDESRDLYERSGGVTTLVSTGPGAPGGEFDATFAGASEDGSKVFFQTSEPISEEDIDATADFYRFTPGGTELMSVGPVGGNGAVPVEPEAVSADGSRALFVTTERLTAEDDFAGERDVYEHTTIGTVMVSLGNSSELLLGPLPPTLEATNPSSPGTSITPTIIGQSDPGTDVKIYANAGCNGEPVAQGTAAELASPGLTVAVPLLPGSTTGFRATAEADGIVSACSSALIYVQRESVSEPPGGGGQEVGEGQPTGGGASGGATGDSTPVGSGSGPDTGPAPGGHGGGIAYVTPLPRITFAPGAKTRLRRPVFRFADATGQPGTRFFCRLDRKHWTGCGSPDKLPKLSPGHHMFSVKAVNALGAAAERAIKRAFRVVKA